MKGFRPHVKLYLLQPAMGRSAGSNNLSHFINGVMLPALRRIRRRARMLLDGTVDRYYSIDTVIYDLPFAFESSRFGDACGNRSISYWLLHRYLDRKFFSPKDTFYDIGCGHGRVLCFVARWRVAKCVGIELSKDFSEKARRNAATQRSRLSPIEVRVGDAAEMDYRDGTIFFFSDPFGAGTMRTVLERIHETVLVNPRRVHCIFVRGSAAREVTQAVGDVIKASAWLTLVGTRSLPYSPLILEHWICEKSAVKESCL
jgi:SAM-dependent methyltransferase